jgi:hypothetical protein
MKNVTVDEALDSVARTLRGIITYGICKRPNGKALFNIDYVFAANLAKPSRVSFEHGKPTDQPLSRLTAPYSVRKPVRRIGFFTSSVFAL